jgi:hypothetical protein
VQVGIDTFLFSGQYTDVATLSVLSKYTAGSTYFYPAFSASRDGRLSCCVGYSVATQLFDRSVTTARPNRVFALQCCRSRAYFVPCLLAMQVSSPSPWLMLFNSLSPNPYPPGAKFEHELHHVLTRATAFEAVMRVRATRGIRFSNFYGNYFIRGTDLLALPNCTADSSFSLDMAYDEAVLSAQAVTIQVSPLVFCCVWRIFGDPAGGVGLLSDFSVPCAFREHRPLLHPLIAYRLLVFLEQAALLYTSAAGERRIRVHTMVIPVTAVSKHAPPCFASALFCKTADRVLVLHLVTPSAPTCLYAPIPTTCVFAYNVFQSVAEMTESLDIDCAMNLLSKQATEIAQKTGTVLHNLRLVCWLCLNESYIELTAALRDGFNALLSLLGADMCRRFCTPQAWRTPGSACTS